MLPDAHVFATVALPEVLPGGLANVPIQTSWMQRLPAMRRLHRFYFGLYPLAVASLDLSEYDVVISSSSGYAKGVRTRSDAIHICYCHTPMRWVWRYRDYAEREKFGTSQRFFLPLLLKGLKTWDSNAARQPDQFVANSRAVATRIRDVYQRESVIIHPPIEVERFAISPTTRNYYLVLSRLVPYKRIDLAVQACTLLGKRLFVIGDGPDRARLEEMAGPSVSFLGRLTDDETSQYASQCKALLFPGEEDFGMVPLEIAAAGRPTIAYRAGGALETVVDGVTGVFFDSPSVNGLAAAIENFETRSWIPHMLRRHARGFDVSTFRRRFYTLLGSLGVETAELNYRTPNRHAELHVASA